MAGEEDAAPVARALLDPDGVFPARLAGDRAALSSYASDVWALGGAAQQERLTQIATLSHRLAGAAGTFGYHAVSDAALNLEAHILDRQPGENLSAWHVSVRQGIEALLRALDDALPA